MTFPLVIHGTGEALAHALVSAHDPASASAGVVLEGVPDSLVIDGSETLALARILDQLRASIAADGSPLLAPIRIALTDGGSLAVADPERDEYAIPIQLLHSTLLGIEGSARRLLLEEAITIIACTIIRDDFCRALNSFSGRLGRDSRQWLAYQGALIFLSTVQRFILHDAGRQLALRLAVERVEQRADDRLTYGGLLKELQEADAREVPPSLVAQVAAQVQLSSQVCPNWLDTRLLVAATKRLRGQTGEKKSHRSDTAKWLIESNESSRLFARRIWPNHQRAAQRVGTVLKDLDTKNNAPRDVLQLISATGAFTHLEPLLDHVRGRGQLAQLPRLMEEFLRELQETPQLGVKIIRTLSRAAIGLVAEFGRDTTSLADDANQLEEFATAANAATCRRTAWLASRLARQAVGRRREQTRHQVQESRRIHRARALSMDALTRFREALTLAGHDTDRLSGVVSDHLATESDLLPGDARTAIQEMLDHVKEQSEIGDRLMALLTVAAGNQGATAAIEQALARRFSPLTEGGTRFTPTTSTELFEVLCNVLAFKDSAVTLDDADVRAQLLSMARGLLDAEEGVLQNALRERGDGDDGAGMSAEAAARVSKATLALQRKVARGAARSRSELADAHFRLGLWAAVRESTSTAIHHFCELIHQTLDEELCAKLDGGRLLAGETAADFARSNAFFQAREDELRRARAAGHYLEGIARLAEGELAQGKVPFVDEEELRKILRTLQTGKTLGDTPPTYKLLRNVPVVRTCGDEVFRVRNLLPPGWGGRSGRIALLSHLFGDATFADWLGYHVVETTAGERTDVTRAYVTRLCIDDRIAGELQRVGANLFPDFATELKRLRVADASQLLVKRMTDELVEFLERESPSDRALVRGYDARKVRIGDHETGFDLLFTEYLPGLRDDFPATRYGQGADEEGRLTVSPEAVFQVESAVTRLHQDVSQRLREELGAGDGEPGRVAEGEVARVCARIRAHAAAMAILTMNVGLRIRSHRGRFVSLAFGRILPPVLDPDYPVADAPTDTPVSYRPDCRIDVPWVTSDDPWMPYLEVGVLYRLFLDESAAKLRSWATGAGFSDQVAGAIRQLLLDNAEHLMTDLEHLHGSGGCALLAPSTRDAEGRIRYGRILPATTLQAPVAIGGEHAKRSPPTTSLHTNHIQERLDSTPAE